MTKPERFRTWRVFLKEFGIIVLGVVTALGVGQAAEWAHHRAQVDEAIRRLRAESLDNRDALAFSMANLHAQLKGVDMRLDVLGDCVSPVDVAQLAPVTHSTTLLPSDTAWLGVRDSALVPLMPREIVDNYWKINSAYNVMLPELQDVIQRTGDARAAVELVRRGTRDPQACVDAVHSLLRLRASLHTLWRQLAFYQSGNEQVLRGERLGVGTAVKTLKDLRTSSQSSAAERHP